MSETKPNSVPRAAFLSCGVAALLALPPIVASLVEPYSLWLLWSSPLHVRALALMMAVALPLWALGALTGVGAAALARRLAPEAPSGLAVLLAVALVSAAIWPLRGLTTALPPVPGLIAAALAACALGLGASALACALCARLGARAAGALALAAVATGALWASVQWGVIRPDLDLRALALAGCALSFALLVGQTLRPLPPAGLRNAALVVALLALVAPPFAVSVRDIGTQRGDSRLSTASPDAIDVLLIVVDTLRADHTAPGGADPELTPAIARLASERSTWFAHATAPASATVPSIKAVFTARPASSWGVKAAKEPPPEDAWTLPQAFARAGYRTAGWSLNGLIDGPGFRNGFDRFWVVGGLPFYQASPLLADLLEGGSRWAVLERTADLRLHLQDGRVGIERAADFISAPRRAPRFAYLHTVDPHWPYYDHDLGWIPPELRGFPEPLRYVDLLKLPKGKPGNARFVGSPALGEMVGRYREEIAYTDRLLGELFERLRASGRADDTMIVLIGDHGEEFFEHLGFSHGHDVFEEQVHVPLLIRWPARPEFEDMPRTIEAAVGLTDLFATLVDYAQLGEQPVRVPGSSLRPLLEGVETEPRPVISEAFWGGGARGAYREGPLKARIGYGGRFTPRDTPQLHVFDLAEDPAERRPLPAEDPRAQALGERARAFFALLREGGAPGSEASEAGAPADAALDHLRALGYID